jgi:hypothetical protein
MAALARSAQVDFRLARDLLADLRRIVEGES